MENVVIRAAEALADLTPLKTDCGKICGARCCSSLDGEETGMLLFPGEEARFRDLAGWRLQDTGRGILAICPGACDRALRPLACRFFPLLPVLRQGRIRVAPDQRARACCPLFRQGLRGMDPAFVEAVRLAGEILALDARQRAFLEALTGEQDELRALRRQLL